MTHPSLGQFDVIPHDRTDDGMTAVSMMSDFVVRTDDDPTAVNVMSVIMIGQTMT